MKIDSILVPTKICTACGQRLPLDAKHWRRASNSFDGFYSQCKDCTKKSLQDHYRKYTKIDLIERGEAGVKCILWSQKCRVCPCTEHDLSACWRIAKINPDSDGYPVDLT
jgi:hypothetical protein